VSIETEVRPDGRRPLTRGLELAYVPLFVGIEVLGLAHPLAAGISHAGMVFLLLNHYVALEQRDRSEPMLLALAVCSLYRVLALTPLPTNVFANHLVLVGAPALLATILALRLTGTPATLPRTTRRPSVGLQFWIALTGAPLSLVAYKLLKPSVVVKYSGPGHAPMAEVAGVVAALVVFSGIGEELLFRVLLHGAARRSFGSSALYLSTAVFGAAYLGTKSAPFVAFAVAVGAFFGWCFERTESVIGVAAAHSFISVGVFVVWPTLAHRFHL
jgi:membrane protease YdiL (CAAX protease family)